MIDLPSCKIVTVIGPVASGKTHLLQQWLQKENRAVVFDATGEFIKDQSFTAVWSSPRELMDRMQQSPFYFRIAYVPGRDVKEDFDWCVKIMWQFDAVKLLAVDECHLVFPNNSIGDHVETTLRFARHAKLGLVAMSQRFADVHKLLISSSRMVIIFRTRAARDYEAVRAAYGSDVAERVANLRPLIHDDSTGITSQIPQCMVCSQDGECRVYDFQTNKYLDGIETAEEPAEEIPDSEGDHTDLQNEHSGTPPEEL